MVYCSPGFSSRSSTRLVVVILGPLRYLRSSPAAMVLVPVLTIVHTISNSAFGRKTVLSKGLRLMALQAYSGFVAVGLAVPAARVAVGRVNGVAVGRIAVGDGGKASV